MVQGGTGFEGTGFHSGKRGGEQSTNAKSNAVPPDLAEVVAVWRRLPAAVRVGILAIVGSSQSLEPRDGEAGLGHERSRTARRCDRQSSPPAAGLDLGAGHSSPGENASPGLSCGFQPFRCPGKSIANRFLDGNESLSYGGPQERGWALFQDVVRGENQCIGETPQNAPPEPLLCSP